MLYQNTLFGLISAPIAKGKPHNDKIAEKLQPIIKWAGGKEKELGHIIPNLPPFERYFEPFVGGGAVFTAIDAKEMFINDRSDELISLYRNIATGNKQFFAYCEAIDLSWQKAECFFKTHKSLLNLYEDYRCETISQSELKGSLKAFCVQYKDEILDIIGEFKRHSCILVKEMEINLYRKMCRTKVLEAEKHSLCVEDLASNIETAVKSAVYMNYRNLYNELSVSKADETLHCALFFFIRNYAYSGMFRYNAAGDFNVPYGGIAYNGKTLEKKLRYYQSDELLSHLAKTNIYNLDFEDFLKETNPNEKDFVFLDPPYDSEFSTYAKNEFTRQDQKRLADFMIEKCKAKWMLVIKNTDFIFSLYNRDGIYIRSFDKEYLVSFMNRNDKKVTHLLITNYPLEGR